MAAVGDLVQSFTMEGNVQVRTFWIASDIPIPTPSGMAEGDGFAAFVRLPGNRDDEWGLFMLGMAAGPTHDRRLATHREAFEAMWKEAIEGEIGGDDELAYQLRRNIAFGTSIGRIAKNAIAQAKLQDTAVSSMTDLQREILTKLPVEEVRRMRDTYRTGGRR